MNTPSLIGISPLMPAYGRDYATSADALADFNSGKDFATPSGAYTNKADLVEMGEARIKIRYARLTEAVIAQVAP